MSYRFPEISDMSLPYLAVSNASGGSGFCDTDSYIRHLLTAYCGPCCQQDLEYISYTSDETYSPATNILLDEPLRPSVSHVAEEIRPTYSGTQPGFEIAYDNDPSPSVTIDLDFPGQVNSNVGVEQLTILGNIRYVKISTKVRFLHVQDNI